MSKGDTPSDKKTRAPFIIVIIVVLLIIIILAASKFIDKYTPTKETMSLYEYFGVDSDDTGAVIELNNEVLDERAVIKDGKAYLRYDFVHDNINSRFYYDNNEGMLFYTLADSGVTVEPGASEYKVAGTANPYDGVITYSDGDNVYIELGFVKQYSKVEYQICENPERIIMYTNFGEYTSVTATSDTEIRYQGGIKSPILEEEAEGESFQVLDEEENWTKVVSETGVMGYIPKSDLAEEESTERTCAYTEEEHEHILLDKTVNLAWHQVTTEAANSDVAQVLGETKDLNVICPTWFYINDNTGNIENLGSSDYVNYCHQNGVQVWGLVSNLENSEVDTTAVLTYSSARINLEEQLINAAVELGLDGINIDFEALSSDVGDGYIQFVREISLKCQTAGLILSVDNYVPSEYTAMYDWNEEAVFADYVILMAYDEHYAGSDEGPVASIGFVKNGIENTLKEGVPADQLVLGIPFYTRVWIETPKDSTGDDVDSASTDYVSYDLSSQALGMDAAAQLISDNGAELTWLEDQGTYYAEYQKDGLTYKIWLEDVTSITEKLEAMKTNELAGVAFWKLELENPSIWDTITGYLN